MKRAAVLAVAVAALVLPAAQGKTPLPAKPQGTGNEPTAGGGIHANAPFRAVSAIAQQDGSGDVFVYIFKKKVGCRLITYEDAPYVWVWVHTSGTPLPVGKPMKTSGTTTFVQVNFVLAGHYVAVQPGVRLTFTRVDASKKGTWHGRLTVAKTTYKGKTYSFNGTFAARWCGKS